MSLSYSGVLREEGKTLAALDFQNPRLDRVAVEEAVTEYLSVCGAPARPLRWVADVKSVRAFHLPILHPAYVPLGSARTWSAMDAAWRAGALGRFETPWQRLPSATFVHYFKRVLDGDDATLPARFAEMLRHAHNDSLPERAYLHAVASAAAPMLKAFAAGLFYLKIEPEAVFCVPRPSLHLVGDRLHREDGPALAWPTGECRYFWKGVHVPGVVVERPHIITPLLIRRERNAERRRCLIERFGVERFVREAGATLVGKDECGQLWRFDFRNDDDSYTVLEVENGTHEPDGSRRRYFLQVPPWMDSPHMAVAWTYGLSPEQYDVAVRT